MSHLSPNDTSWTLIRYAAEGDGPARSVFARTYLPLIRSFFVSRWRGVRQADEVDDAVQDTFVECFREAGPLRKAQATTCDFRAYLFGVVRHVAERIEARRGRVPSAEHLDLDGVEGREERTSRVFDREWAQTMMRIAAELMEVRAEAGGAGARMRVNVLRLRFQEGLPIRDIADEWNMDPDVLHRAYARARDEFHGCLRLVVRDHVVRTEDDLDAECRRLLDMLG